jgi:hypothetical protein
VDCTVSFAHSMVGERQLTSPAPHHVLDALLSNTKRSIPAIKPRLGQFLHERRLLVLPRSASYPFALSSGISPYRA